MQILTFHNVAQDGAGRPLGMLDGYAPEHPLALVARLEVAEEPGVQKADEELAEEVYELFNVGDDPEFGTPDPRAQEYRFRGNRSLSKGDVVLIADRAYAVASYGYDRIPADQPLVVVNYRDRGTNSLD